MSQAAAPEKTKKRGQGPSFVMPEDKGARDTTQRVFPRAESTLASRGPLSLSDSPWTSLPGDRREPWMAPGAPAYIPTVDMVPGIQDKPDPATFTLGLFSLDFERALAYAKKVNEEIASGKPYSLSKEQQVYEPFIIPFGACVFWQRYKYLGTHLGSGAYGIVLGFEYNGKELAVKFQRYDSNNLVEYRDTANEIAMNALINQLPEEQRFGVVRMYDWARCYFSFPQAIGDVRAKELINESNAMFIMQPQVYQMLVLDRAESTLRETFIRVTDQNDEIKTYKFWTAAYLQILATQLYLWRNLRFWHVDLHWQNVLTKTEPDKGKTHILYHFHSAKYTGSYYRVPLANTNNLLMMISDMGRATSDAKQLIRGSAFQDEQVLRKMIDLDVLYAENMFARITTRAKINDAETKKMTDRALAVLSHVKSLIENIGYVDFEQLIFRTAAFDQYKTSNTVRLPTDRFMDVLDSENIAFTHIAGNRRG